MEGSFSVSASGNQDIAIGQDTMLHEDDVFEVNPVVAIEQGVACQRQTTTEFNKVEKMLIKGAQKEKQGELPAQNGPGRDEVDRAASKKTRKVADVKELDRRSGKNQTECKYPSTGDLLNLSTDVIIPTSNNEHNLHHHCRSLTVRVITKNSKGSGSLIHPKIHKKFKDSQSLHNISMPESKAESASLMIKTSKKLIATDADAATAVVEITLYHDDIGHQQVLRFDRCSKECYDIEDCNLLVCHNVPMKVCEYLEKTYESLCRLADIKSSDRTFSNKFLLVGHRNGGEIVISEGNFRNTVNSKGYKYLSLEESADHFFTRTLEMTPEDWSNVKRNTCPGDESISVIRFVPDSFS